MNTSFKIIFLVSLLGISELGFAQSAMHFMGTDAATLFDMMADATSTKKFEVHGKGATRRSVVIEGVKDFYAAIHSSTKVSPEKASESVPELSSALVSCDNLDATVYDTFFGHRHKKKMSSPD